MISAATLNSELINKNRAGFCAGDQPCGCRGQYSRR